MKSKQARKAAASRHIVIDTNILRGASKAQAGPPPGSVCRDALDHILASNHRMVTCRYLVAEYEKHCGKHGLIFWRSMQRKKRVSRTAGAPTAYSERWVEDVRLGSNQKKELAKDVPLVLAAIEESGSVLSQETNARDLLARVLDAKDPKVAWAVLAADDDPLRWLKAGANPADAWIETPRT